MKNNNIAHENIRCVSCGIALMPMKEVYTQMYGDVVMAHNALAAANSSKVIRHILQKIYQYPVDNRVSEQIRNMVADIKGNVRAMHMNDYTRSDMCNDMAQLLLALNDAIEEEALKEVVEDARHFFQVMVDHAEEFVGWYKEIHEKQ